MLVWRPRSVVATRNRDGGRAGGVLREYTVQKGTSQIQSVSGKVNRIAWKK